MSEAEPLTSDSTTNASPQSGPANAGDHAPTLSPEHYAQLAAAHAAYGPIRRALRVVTLSAWSLGVFAVISLPFAAFSMKGLYVALSLTSTTFFEFRGRSAMRRLDSRGVKILTLNQIVLTVLLTIYCLWSMADAYYDRGRFAEVIARYPEIGELLGPENDLIRQMVLGTYAIVLLVGLLFQALVIRYYATRRRHIERYLSQTPEWILSWNKTRSLPQSHDA